MFFSKSFNTLKSIISLNNIVSYTLSLIVLILYFTFILIVGFYPQLFQIYLFNTSITFGIAFGLFIILFSIFLTLVYVLISNFYLDKVKDFNEFPEFFVPGLNSAEVWDKLPNEYKRHPRTSSDAIDIWLKQFPRHKENSQLIAIVKDWQKLFKVNDTKKILFHLWNDLEIISSKSSVSIFLITSLFITTISLDGYLFQ